MAVVWVVAHLLFVGGVATWARRRIGAEADERDARLADEVRLGFLDDIRFDDRCPAAWHVGRGAWMIFSLPIGSRAFLLTPDGRVEQLPPRGPARRVQIATAIGVDPTELDSEARLRPPVLVRRYFLPTTLVAWLVGAFIAYGQPGSPSTLSVLVAVLVPAVVCAIGMWRLRSLERSSDAAPRLPSSWRRNTLTYV